MVLSSFSSLQQRVISACILGPIAIAALYLGGIYFTLFLGAAAAVMCFEWSRASFTKRSTLFTVLIGLAVLLPLIFINKYNLEQLVIGIFCSSILIAGIALILKQTADALWAFLGPVCIGFPVLSLAILRTIPEIGLAVTLSLFLVIWATDIGAYFSGKSIGGPKIAPRISPNKTWAGLIGGMIAAMIVAYAAYTLLMGGNVSPIRILGLGAICAILAQTSDFAESAWKRNFGIKDASNLIPGHGGVLDRLDGIFLVAPSLLVILLYADRN